MIPMAPGRRGFPESLWQLRSPSEMLKIGVCAEEWTVNHCQLKGPWWTMTGKSGCGSRWSSRFSRYGLLALDVYGLLWIAMGFYGLFAPEGESAIYSAPSLWPSLQCPEPNTGTGGGSRSQPAVVSCSKTRRVRCQLNPTWISKKN